MTEYGLDPAFVKLHYTSAYAPHVHIIPTLNWIPTSITGTLGSYVAWNSVPIDAEVMIDNLIDKLRPFADPTTSYDLIEIFTKASPSDPNVLVATAARTLAGTSAAAGVRKAVQATFNFKTTGGAAFKLVFLDYPHGTGQFDKQPAIALSADAVALAAEITDVGNAWAGRDKTRPSTIISVTNTLNEALRKQYRMG